MTHEAIGLYTTLATWACLCLAMFAVVAGAIVYPRRQFARFRRSTAGTHPQLRVAIDPLARPAVSLKDLPRWHYFLMGMLFMLWLEDILTQPFSRSIAQLMLLSWIAFQWGTGKLQRTRWMNVVSELLVDRCGIYYSSHSTRKNPSGLIPWSNIHRHWMGGNSLGFTAHRLDRPNSGSFVLGIPLYGVDDETKTKLDDLFREHLGLGPRLHREPTEAAVA